MKFEFVDSIPTKKTRSGKMAAFTILITARPMIVIYGLKMIPTY